MNKISNLFLIEFECNKRFLFKEENIKDTKVL